jgi:hypothetical protein
MAASGASGETRGVRAAALPIIDHLERNFPRATQQFVNCPAINTAPAQDGSEGLVCEFRIVNRNSTIRGSAVSAESEGRWAVRYFFAGRPLPHRWKRCAIGMLKGLPSSTPRRLSVHGVSCQDAQIMASTIQYRASTADDLRLPRRFTEARYGTNSLGFVTNTFQCTGRVQVRKGNPNPYGRETARCRTRFGDRFVYVFDQGS